MRHRPLFVAVVLGLLALLIQPVPAVADVRPDGLLPDDSTIVRWSGEFSAAATGPVAPDPAACTTLPACDSVAVDLTVPSSAWAASPGGLLVAIQWPVMDAGYDLDLYLYRAGDPSPVGSSTSTAFSRHEAAWLVNPPPGRYSVVVAAKSVVAQSLLPRMLTPLRYEGAARIERGLTVERTESDRGLASTRRFLAFGAAAPSGAPLLPDLVPTTPVGFHVESGWGAHYYFYGDRGVRHPPSCYPQESAGVTADNPRPGGGPQRCLRWDQGEYNLGDGPLELHNYPLEGAGDEMWQRIYSADGHATQTQVGETVFSANHGHLHYLGFTVVTLHRLAPDGSPGAEIVRAPDKGICLVDVEVATLTGERTSPLSYGVPGTCDAASHVDAADPTYPNSRYFAMGISVGAADIYPWYLADQYLDITAVPDGRYLLRVQIDAAGKLMEKTHDNNIALTCVNLRGGDAALC